MSQPFSFSTDIVGKLEESSKQVQDKVSTAEKGIECIQEAISGAMRVVIEAQQKIRGFYKQLKDLSSKTHQSLSAANLQQTGDQNGQPHGKKMSRFSWKLAVGVLLMLASIYGFLVLFVEDMKKYRIKGLDSEEAAWAIPVASLAASLLFFALWYRDQLAS